MAKTHGWDSPEAFKKLNGYLQTVPAMSIVRVFDGLEPDTDVPHPGTHAATTEHRLTGDDAV
jgi:hypothetical protein